MSRRDKERKESLDLLGRIAHSVGQPIVPPKPSPSIPTARPPAPAPRPASPARPAAARPAPQAPAPSYASGEAERVRRRQMEERKAKLDEERALRERRERELARNRSLEWRGGGFTDIPASIRRTGFDRSEPTLDAKIGDVLGTPAVKEGREKHRDKGRRQGGR